MDGSICRVVLEAIAPGEIPGLALAGVGVRICAEADELRNEVKRIGFIRDRESQVQIRVGDTLVLYISNCFA